MRQHPEITAVSRDRGGEYAKAAAQGAPQAVQYADRFHLCKNLSEAAQPLLARCQAEIALLSNMEEPERNEQAKAVISIEEWRPPEPAHVEKVRLARRAGRYARYQQVLELREQGMKPKEIAKLLDLSQRTVQRWMTAEAFPEAKNGAKGKVALMILLPMCSNAGRRESTMVSPSGKKSSNRGIPERSEPCTVIWKRSSKQK